MSALGGKADEIESSGAFQLLTLAV